MTHTGLLFTTAAVFLAAAISILLLIYRKSDSFDPGSKKWVTYSLFLFVCIGGALVFVLTLKAVRNPPEFDFLLFWINGKMAAQGLNYYSSQAASELFQLSQPSEEFRRELLNNPFLYPPPTILFFLPLGWLSFKSGALVWYAFHTACLLISIPLLSRVFLRDRSLRSTLLVGLLMLAMYGTYSNIKTGQTLFLLLLLVTLFFRAQNAYSGGIWLGLCSLLKPFAAVLFLYAVIRRKWKAAGGALVTLGISALLTLMLFGPGVFKSYFLSTNYGALPRSFYLEPQNQSLLAWILRLAGDTKGSLVGFGLIAVVLAGVTVWRSFHLSREGDRIVFALALMLALLIYPGSLRSYSILLIVPILVLVRRNLVWPIALTYGLMLLGGGNFIGLASTLLWLVFASATIEPPVRVQGLPLVYTPATPGI